MGDLAFKATILLTGVVVAGEALALLIGMRVLSRGENTWVSAKNDLFLTLDIVAGVGFVFLALVHRGLAWPYAFALLAGLGLLTHGYRTWEYLAGASNAFCANAPLFVVNNLKLAGLLVILALGIVQLSRGDLQHCFEGGMGMDRHQDSMRPGGA